MLKWLFGNRRNTGSRASNVVTDEEPWRQHIEIEGRIGRLDRVEEVRQHPELDRLIKDTSRRAMVVVVGDKRTQPGPFCSRLALEAEEARSAKIVPPIDPTLPGAIQKLLDRVHSISGLNCRDPEYAREILSDREQRSYPMILVFQCVYGDVIDGRARELLGKFAAEFIKIWPETHSDLCLICLDGEANMPDAQDVESMVPEVFQRFHPFFDRPYPIMITSKVSWADCSRWRNEILNDIKFSRENASEFNMNLNIVKNYFDQHDDRHFDELYHDLYDCVLKGFKSPVPSFKVG